MKNNLLDRYRKVMLPAIESELRLNISHTDSQWQRYYGMMRYHLGWEDQNWQPVSSTSGKRVRPMLCLLTAEAVSGDWKTALPAAAAVELLHNFSLIHDDIEDNSDTRRGRSTVWSIWGIPQAINTGDGMYAAAFQAMTQLEIDSHRLAEVYTVFTQASTQLTMGQHLDMLFEDDTTTTLDDYATMIKGKTAALLSASTELGAIVAGADGDTRACLAKFGQRLGMAFQVMDDYLGIWGDPKYTGKSAASDLLARKRPIP